MRSPATTLDNLVAELHEKTSVLQGWDVVLNLPEATIGNVVRKQWSATCRPAPSDWPPSGERGSGGAGWSRTLS